MPNNVCLYLSLWAGRYLWLQDLGKDRGSRVGKKNSKPAVVAVKRDKECVCVWGKVGEGGRVWGKRPSLGISEQLGNVCELCYERILYTLQQD